MSNWLRKAICANGLFEKALHAWHYWSVCVICGYCILWFGVVALDSSGYSKVVMYPILDGGRRIRYVDGISGPWG